MQRFAKTIRQDLEAVRNAMSEPWSNGHKPASASSGASHPASPAPRVNQTLIEAYVAAKEALGAERAVWFAVRGEVWRPFDVREEAEALFFGAARR